MADSLSEEVTYRIQGDLAEAQARAAAIAAESKARTDGLLAEAQARGIAIANEQVLREEATSQLAQQISTLTAGVAGGFDPFTTWYFDSGLDGWTGVTGTLTANSGWIDFVATSSNGHIQSPAGLSIKGSEYSTVRARIKRLAGTGW